MKTAPRPWLGHLAALACLSGGPSAMAAEDREPKRVAITFDDLPFAGAKIGTAPESGRRAS